MGDPNEFFREFTLKLCGHFEIEEGLPACIKYLSQHMPADAIYLQKYEENLGVMRFIARANPEKGERMASTGQMVTQSPCKNDKTH